MEGQLVGNAPIPVQVGPRFWIDPQTGEPVAELATVRCLTNSPSGSHATLLMNSRRPPPDLPLPPDVTWDKAMLALPPEPVPEGGWFGTCVPLGPRGRPVVLNFLVEWAPGADTGLYDDEEDAYRTQ